MKRKIKLRDITAEQWDENKGIECDKCKCCDNCKFGYINCDTSKFKSSWINHKEMYSDKFLNQEIEIEIPDILNKEEKECLSNIIKPFRSRIVRIRKCMIKFGAKKDETFYYIQIIMKSRTKILCNKFIDLPLPDSEKYKGMKFYKQYTLEELGL